MESAEGCVIGVDAPMDDPAHDPFLDFYADMGVDEAFYGRKVQAQIRPSTVFG